MKSRIAFGLLCLIVLGNVYGAANNWENNLLNTYVPAAQREEFVALQGIRDRHQQQWISRKIQAYCVPEREFLWSMVLEQVFKISTTPESREWFDQLMNVTMAGPEDHSALAKQMAAPNYGVVSRISPHNRAEVLSVLEALSARMPRAKRVSWLRTCAAFGDRSLAEWRELLEVVRREQGRLPAGRFLDPNQPPLRDELYRIFR